MLLFLRLQDQRRMLPAPAASGPSMARLTRCAFVGRVAQLESAFGTELVEVVAHRLVISKDVLAGGRDVERIVGGGGNVSRG